VDRLMKFYFVDYLTPSKSSTPLFLSNIWCVLCRGNVW